MLKKNQSWQIQASFIKLALPFTLMTTDSVVKANPLTVALHEYEPLSDCPIDLNCSWLIVTVDTIFTLELLSSSGVLPSGGPSH